MLIYLLGISWRMKVAVGSKNPVKVAAVQSSFEKVWSCECVPCSVPSGVSDQPVGDDEARKGALNRAIAARDHLNADFGVGLEGYVVDSEYGMFLCGWVAVVNKEGKRGFGSAGHVLLPERIASRLRKGEELGPVMDDVVEDHNTKQKQGAVGILTKGMVLRQQGFERAVVFALAPFVNELY